LLLQDANAFIDNSADYDLGKNKEFDVDAQKDRRDEVVSDFRKGPGSTAQFGVSAGSLFEEAGLSFDEVAYQLVSNANDKLLKTIAATMISLQAELADMAPDDESRALVQLKLEAMDKLFKDGMEHAIKNPPAEMVLQAEKFVDNMRNNLQGAMDGFFEGQADEGESVWSTFTQRLKDGFIGTILGSFSSQFVSGIFEGISNVFESEFANAFGGIGKMLGEMMGSVLKFIFQGLGLSVGAPAALASGGLIRGPGTSTSDSIPALLSDGEYVINAKSTARYGSLLESINQGGLRGFADGGKVSSAAMSNERLRATPPSRRPAETVVNLSITGDISKQTKKEIFGMLPQLAHGINSYNRDRGYR